MKIAITGSSGFIGGYLVNSLNKTKHDLILLDIATGIDVCSWNQIKEISGIDVFIHLANKTFIPDSYNDPKSFYDSNFSSTLNVLELCRINKAKFIYLSSYVYGIPKYQPIDEVHPVKALNPYSQSKILCEGICEGYNRDFEVPIIILRPFNIYGSGQHENFLIPSIIKQSKNAKIQIKDERPKRDYLHVLDLTDAIIKAIEFPLDKELQIFNIGYGISYSVKEVVEFVISNCQNPTEYICTHEIRPNEVIDTIADINHIRSILKWEPKITFFEGIKLIMSTTI